MRKKETRTPSTHLARQEGRIAYFWDKTGLPTLRDIGLTSFRNYPRRDFSFPARVSAICGPNGTGKTNLLDAVHYLSFTKSYFTRPDAASVGHGGSGFRIRGRWTKGLQDTETVCILRENGRKEFWVDGDPLTRFSEHIGHLPAVFIAPDDIALVNGPPEERRRFIDTVLSQVDPDYLQALIRYNRILQQRNTHLKDLAKEPARPSSLLDVYDEQLSAEGTRIHAFRKSFLRDFIPAVLDLCRRISGSDEALGVAYASQLDEAPMLERLLEGRKLDMLMQRTRTGIHRDELELSLDGHPLRQTASQGQRKSLLFALKLAEYEHIRQVKGFPPVLLLDDIFEKLDGSRMQNLLTWVCRDSPGQVLLTDTHPERVESVLGQAGIDFDLLRI
jgi:DNA replication and repair protein RecF